MSKFKITNADSPIEKDLYQDIPIKDPETGLDQVDSEGNILAKEIIKKEKLENDGSIYGIWSDCSAMCLVFAVLPYPRREEMASRESYDIGQ